MWGYYYESGNIAEFAREAFAGETVFEQQVFEQQTLVFEKHLRGRLSLNNKVMVRFAVMKQGNVGRVLSIKIIRVRIIIFIGVRL